MTMISATTIAETSTLPLMESFYTLQGEGFHQGRAAYFIRLAGCDVGCVWCDVKESWDKNLHTEIPIEEIINKAKKEPARIAVITGGEPAMYNLIELTNGLHKENFTTHIETSGAYALTGNWDWICVSPKKFKEPLQENVAKANELKVIVFNKSDFAWAEKNASLTSASCKLYLQPEWSKSSQVTPMIVDYIKQHPQWELSLQIHKYINVP